MKLGFTGTSKGMSPEQLGTLTWFLQRRGCNITEFHHGDCIGADAQAHELVRRYTKAKIHVHPPANSSKQARCVGDFLHTPADYLVRNHDIVDAVDWVLAAPRTAAEQSRSGTWATVRYARKAEKQVTIIKPRNRIIRRRIKCRKPS